MITDKDVKKLKEAFKDTFATKEDLHAIEKRQDAKFATKEDLKELKVDFFVELSKTRKGIIDDIETLISETLFPYIDKQDKRIAAIEKRLNIHNQVD